MALASISFNLLNNVSVKTLESVASPTRVLISEAVWSAVALASISFNLLNNVSVKTFESKASPTRVLISAAV